MQFGASSRQGASLSIKKSDFTRKSLVVDGDEALDERSDDMFEEPQPAKKIAAAQDDDDEYVDDDFEPVENSESEVDLAQVSISQSGRLPPLSAANPSGNFVPNKS